ncbi:MAG TPA: radical SAM protein, partial [bacterium]|nr:radical SAM protein [bacterium]
PDFAHCLADARETAENLLPNLARDADLSAADRARDLARKAKALRKVAENYAVNQIRYRRGDHALRPLYVIWTMLNDCNFRCAYCDNHQGRAYFDVPDPARLDTAGGRRLLEVMITGTPAIYWCGGEPTLRHDLPELLDHAWRLGYFPNMINTNGSLLHRRLADPAWSRFLRQMDVVIVSLDGLDVARLDELWGVRQAERVFTNILLLRELRREIDFKLAVNTVITRETIDEARAVLDLMSDLDVWFVPVPVNHRHEPDRALLNDPAYRALAEEILTRKRRGHKIIGSERLLRRLLYAEPYRCFTALKPHVWSNGEICWPCRAAANVAPVSLQLLDYADFDEAYRAGAKLVNPNFFHGPAKNQCGGQCAWMQNYTTARYMDGLLHPLTGGLLGEMFAFAFGGRG